MKCFVLQTAASEAERWNNHPNMKREPKSGIRSVTKTPTTPSLIGTLLFLTFYISAGNIETLSSHMYWMLGNIAAQTSSGPSLWQE